MADASGLRAKALERWGRAFDDSCQTLEQALQDAAPLGETGDTRRGISVRPGGVPGNGFAATALSASPHGDFVENGTAPHIIVPRSAKVLAFSGAGGRISQPGPNQRVPTRGGATVFAMIVHHPGTPPRPWFAPEIERWPQMLAQSLAALP